MRPASLPLVVLGALFALLTLASSASAATQKSCRQCDCEFKLSRYVKGDEFADYMSLWEDTMTGGDGYYWTSVAPTAPDWRGNMKVWRLCGNGEKVVWTDFNHYWNPQETEEHLKCKCTKSVPCLKGSACQYSGL